MHVTTWESIAKALLPYHTAGWRSADSNPHFSKQGRDWLWTSNEPQTQRSANKLIKHSWEWRGQQSAETPQPRCPLRGLLCISLLTCQYSSAAPGSDAMSTRCFPWAGKAVVAPGGEEGILLHGVVSPTLVFAVVWLDVMCVWPCWLLSQCPWETIQNNWFSFPAICFCPCSRGRLWLHHCITRFCRHL